MLPWGGVDVVASKHGGPVCGQSVNGRMNVETTLGCGFMSDGTRAGAGSPHGLCRQLHRRFPEFPHVQTDRVSELSAGQPSAPGTAASSSTTR